MITCAFRRKPSKRAGSLKRGDGNGRTPAAKSGGLSRSAPTPKDSIAKQSHLGEDGAAGRRSAPVEPTTVRPPAPGAPPDLRN